MNEMRVSVMYFPTITETEHKQRQRHTRLVPRIGDRIDWAPRDEVERIRVASKFIPLYGSLPDALTVPSDTVADGQGVLSIDEDATREEASENGLEYLLML